MLIFANVWMKKIHGIKKRQHKRKYFEIRRISSAIRQRIPNRKRAVQGKDTVQPGFYVFSIRTRHFSSLSPETGEKPHFENTEREGRLSA